ncbi:MurD-like peptide ligase, catalytic [Glarea lozoyensis ATCC 20868]|uniref:Folylpolyglutamate synthase n=1 Tax=Glarea lozoyensis (strain ATCC 20868 / MF5171) TaxID=1116229 RepID=S3D5V6_GLAL2|nr:MurD-like peptide ligase, catalytic [Glarea lozoyensis ATCC 20868]EPE27476.1 MurD-like peptide ligase, catalytic [Glarea lozoyensis ATCC 20868]
MTSIFSLPPTIRCAVALFLLPSSSHFPSKSPIQTRHKSTSSHHPRKVQYMRAPFSYDDSLKLLSTLQTNRAIRTSLDATTDKNKDAIPEMLEWFRKAGYEPADLARSGIKCVHVAGSSGKGSVCAMIENLLVHHQDYEDVDAVASERIQGQLEKIGTYTSPHLVDVRERIRINGAPISKVLFLKHFSALWERFGRVAGNRDFEGVEPLGDVEEVRPGYFRFLTILAFQIFMEEGVKTAVVECGIGGEYDSTNILPTEAVAVSVITKLELDHVGMLGDTIEDIAWHKAGIIRAEPPAFTAPQVQGALEVVLRRAAVMGADFAVTHRLPVLETDTITLGLLGDFQKDNASLAVVAAAAFLRDIGVDAESLPTPDEIADGDPLPDRFVRGLETVSWPGRCEIYKNGNLEWCLDGAHTDEGMRAVAKWFRGKMDAAYAETDTATMLIFNQDERDGNALLCTLIEALTDLEEGAVHYSRMFKFAAFCPNEAFPVAKGEEERDLSKQQKLLRTYMNMDRNAVAAVYSSVGEAVHAAVRVSDRTKQRALVLVTGSLHLVGAWIENVPEKHRLRSGK